MTKARRTVFACTIAAMLSDVTAADIINVPGDFATIQAAIDVAEAGDEVVVAPGIYGESIDFGGKAITVRSSAGRVVTVIDPLGGGDPVVTFDDGEDELSVLQGFTIRNGADSGMLLIGSDPTVIECKFSGNVGAGWGGGAYLSNSSPTFDRCEFFRNEAEWGGALFLNGLSGPIVTSCTFTENTATADGLAIGGAVYGSHGAYPVFDDCAFVDNTADDRGGAMEINGPTETLLRGCTFTTNTADRGGAIYGDADIISENCTFADNAATKGGAMYNDDGSTSPTIRGCLFVGNTATESGGAIENVWCSPFITETCFEGNTAGTTGGAMYSNRSPSLILDCEFRENVSTNSGGAIGTFGLNVEFPTIVGTAFCSNTPDHIDGEYFDEGGNTFDDVCVPPCPRDLDDSGAVDFGDILAILAAWGNAGGPEDLDGSGTVDFGDLLVVLGSWGPCE